jgi:hypothetical protein
MTPGFQSHFTSPSSAREVEGDGNGADILENNRRARRALNHFKVKTCVASIINMRKVTPRSLAYVVCQVRKDNHQWTSTYDLLLAGSFRAIQRLVMAHYRWRL